MKFTKSLILLFAIVVVSSCGSPAWIKSDKTSASDDEIMKAKEACNVYKKEEELRTKRITTKVLKSQAQTSKQKQEWDDAYKQSVAKANAEIEECMREKGFILSS